MPNYTLTIKYINIDLNIIISITNILAMSLKQLLRDHFCCRPNYAICSLKTTTQLVNFVCVLSEVQTAKSFHMVFSTHPIC